MIKWKIIVGTKNVNLSSLTQNDSMKEKTPEEYRTGGPLPTRPIIYSILSLKNPSIAQSHFDYMRLTMTEGKNRMIEQINDSNLSKIDLTGESNASFIIKKIVKIISEEVVFGHKLIQLIHLIETGVALDYRSMIVLDEYISYTFPKLKEIDESNKRANHLFKRALMFIDENFINKAEKLQEQYLKNPDVSDEMKNYLLVVGLDWIKSSKNVAVIYKSFKRRAKMNKAQFIFLQNFVKEVRQTLILKTDLDVLLNLFKLDFDYYKEHKEKALEPIDDFLESFENFGN